MFKILYNFFTIAHKITAYLFKAIRNFFTSNPGDRPASPNNIGNLPFVFSELESHSPGLTTDLEEHFRYRTAVLNDYNAKMLKLGESDDLEVKHLETQRNEIMNFTRTDICFVQHLETYLMRFDIFQSLCDMDDDYQKLFANNYPKLQKHITVLRARAL